MPHEVQRHPPRAFPGVDIDRIHYARGAVNYAARADANQPEIMAALRKIGASVQPLHTVGKGCPDLLVGFRGRCYLFEVKDGTRPPSERKLNDEQEKWHKNWTGQVGIVESAVQAVEMLLALSRLAA